jgi:hypothetical protein
LLAIELNESNRGFSLQKRSQLFIGTHNGTLSVTVGVRTPDRSRILGLGSARLI